MNYNNICFFLFSVGDPNPDVIAEDLAPEGMVLDATNYIFGKATESGWYDYLGGITIPGFPHVGPGNEVDWYTARLNPVDNAARYHDMYYTVLGTASYTSYVDADRILQRDAWRVAQTSWNLWDQVSANIADGTFAIKKFAADVGILNHLTEAEYTTRQRRGVHLVDQLITIEARDQVGVDTQREAVIKELRTYET